MKYIMIVLSIALLVGTGAGQDQNASAGASVDLKSNNGETEQVIRPAQKENTISPRESKIPVVPVPRQTAKTSKRPAMGSAGTSGPPMLKKPLVQSVSPDLEAIHKKFAGVNKVKLSKKN
jgi:hypothetical protein